MAITKANLVLLSFLAVIACFALPSVSSSMQRRLLVNMTLVRNASALGALCLDGSLPAYHFHRGFGAGARNWLLQFEGGGWCNDINSCLERANTRRGSTRYMTKFEVFSGILSNNASLNPDFYNWNRVKIRYCDGASFAGEGSFNNGVPSDYHIKLFICLKMVFFMDWNVFLLVMYETPNECCCVNLINSEIDIKPVIVFWCDQFPSCSLYNETQTSLLYFRGQRIWEAIIHDLLPKGLGQANKALLSGCSAGGLAVFLHCDNFAKHLPANSTVKCLSDAGFFLDERDIGLNHTMRSFFKSLISLQGVDKNLDKNCTKSFIFPDLCFFPQYALRFIQTPFFILNSAYDVYQFHHGLVPPLADPRGHWKSCKLDPSACNANQTSILQGFRRDMIVALFQFFKYSRRGGMFINSCFAHCQSESQDTWLAVDSPRVHNRTIAEAVGDWYFGRKVAKDIDCAYPCDTTCHNLIP